MAKAVKKTTKKTTAKQASSNTATPKKTTTRRRATQPKVATVTPTHQQIEQRAFEIFLARNGAPGDAHSDWLQAERELRTELAGK